MKSEGEVHRVHRFYKRWDLLYKGCVAFLYSVDIFL